MSVRTLCSSALFASILAACDTSPPVAAFSYPYDDSLRLDQRQVKGTHNSYHVETPGVGYLPWRYTHQPLPEQLSRQGVRQFELDVYYDADVRGSFDVLHAPLADPGTTCRLLVECLQQLKDWSDRNPAHEPLIFFIEAKEQLEADFAPTYFDRLEAAILSVWPKERLFTPDELRRDAKDLPTALRRYGWPTLGQLRQRALLVLVDRVFSGRNRSLYTFGDQRLDGRLMFPDSEPDRFDGAVAMYENPRSDAEKIARALSAGLLVWTLADEDGVEAQENDRSRLEVALASGAHMISTDYPGPVPGQKYWVDIPDGTPSRCNPLTAPASCSSLSIENPSFLAVSDR